MDLNITVLSVYIAIKVPFFLRMVFVNNPENGHFVVS